MYHWFPARFSQLPTNSSHHFKRHLCLLTKEKRRRAFPLKMEICHSNSPSPNDPRWAGNGERLRACQSTVIQKLSEVGPGPFSVFSSIRHRTHPFLNSTPVKLSAGEQKQMKEALTTECSILPTKLKISYRLSPVENVLQVKNKRHGGRFFFFWVN